MLRGDDVAELQRRLNALGFDAGREDGILGPETEAALRAVPARRRARPRRRRAARRPSPRSTGSARSPTARSRAVREREALRRDAAPARGPRLLRRRRPRPRRARRPRSPAGLRDARARSSRSTPPGDDDRVARRRGQPLRRRRVPRARDRRREPGARCAYFANRARSGPRAASAIADRTHRGARGRRCPDVERAGRPHLPAAARDADGRGRLRARSPRDDPAGATPLAPSCPASSRTRSSTACGAASSSRSTSHPDARRSRSRSRSVARSSASVGALGHRRGRSARGPRGSRSRSATRPWLRAHRDLHPRLEVVAEQLFELEQARRPQLRSRSARSRRRASALSLRGRGSPPRPRGPTGRRSPRAAASCSWNARSGVPSSARAWPMRSDPSFT